MQTTNVALQGRPNRLRAMLDNEARHAGTILRTIIEADSLTVQRELAASGRAYALLGPGRSRQTSVRGAWALPG
ncbi:hypothetical protein [Paraburkholderia sp. MM5384-R2]|uniref:hypothetical protein n=1 Tax=Paraburkholderia sp. MM5384-R2 TaxID=2723097 RepID=UPI00161B56B1|nr:hypothetical protein [Paraburkholderia sp. MM5384-R2]MBB5499397.1 hypothetical protein [Paraburkholderia sp. MM5384-R2]